MNLFRRKKEIVIGAWIPVSKRLPPTKNRYYLVSTLNGHVTLAKYVGDGYTLFEEPLEWSFMSMSLWRAKEELGPIVAWQEKPSPYKENENG